MRDRRKLRRILAAAILLLGCGNATAAPVGAR